MTERPYDKVIARLEGVLPSSRSGPRKCTARCPAHDDRKRSLSVRETSDGTVIVKCFAGCANEAIAERIGVPFREWFPAERVRTERPPTSGRSGEGRLTVDALARAKKLPPAFLRRLGLHESGRHVLIPYRDGRGNEARPQLRRADGEHRWGRPAEAPVLPYGLDRRPVDGALALVEGCSDCWTLWHAGFDALGLPGADMTGKLEAAHVAGTERLYVVQEDDAGGATFVRGMAARLREIGYGGDVRLVAMAEAGANDPSALYLRDPDAFAAAWERLIEAAPVLGAFAEDAEPEEAPAPIGVLVSDVARESVAWLWPGRLALGKLTILDGDPGLGKSTVYCDLAARLTRCSDWPDGVPVSESGGVVIVTTEDGIADTIRPRLEEAGADLGRVSVVQLIPERDGPGRVPVLPDDIELLMAECRRIGARLLVIDPLMAHLGADTNSYRDQDVRRALAPLSEAAERYGVAVLVLRHLNKATGGSALYRGGGSIGIVGAARIGLLAGRDPDDGERVVLACAKNNLARRPDSLAFRLVPSDGDPGTAVIRWEGTSALTAEDLCRPVRQETARDSAAEWLADFLGSGPRPSAEVFAEGAGAGHSKRTLYRAKDELGVEAHKQGFDGGWAWSLPPNFPKAANPGGGSLRGSSQPRPHGDGADGPPPAGLWDGDDLGMDEDYEPGEAPF